MKIIKNIKTKIFFFALVGATIVSCTDYLNVDKDTDNPKVVSFASLLSSTQVDLSQVGDFYVYGGANLEVYVHQMCDRGTSDQYATKPDDGNVSNDWNLLYKAVRDINNLIKQGTQAGNLVYVGIAQIQKAYLMSVAVDLWGDVPYTEAGLADENIISPVFDNQKFVYEEIFKLLNLGKLNVVSGKGLELPLADDLIYGGDAIKWNKFANTFKLKLYNQLKNTSDFDNVGFNNLVALPPSEFMESSSDDFQFIQTSVTSTDLSGNERNRFYVESYNSTQFGSYISPWFYEILKGVNPSIHKLNPDPRMKYMIFNQIKAGVLPPVRAGLDPKADYWDKASGFFSIRFGSTGPNRDQAAETSYSYPGIFPAGGRYDDGLGGNAKTLANCKGVAPRRILTYDEFLFVQAELILSGKISTGNAATKLSDAITANFAKIDDVVTKGLAGGTSSQVVPKLIGSVNASGFITKIGIEYAAATSAKKLEIIMTQKWVATFGDAIDQYTDYRRTGYPVLANPNSTTAEYQLNNADAYPLNDAFTSFGGLTSYPQSLFWPQRELNGNKNAPAQKQAVNYKIFWNL